MSIIEQVKQAGIVGCGGAGFPTHVKLDCSVTDLIINAAECEPLLRTDRWLMKNRPAEIIAGAQIIGEQVGAKQIHIALKETYREEAKALNREIQKAKSPVQLYYMKNFYPAGDEQAMVLDITGKTVPPAGIPLDVGAVVSNTATVYGVYEAVQGKPFTHKYLTVTGAVARPTILRVPLGTSCETCIEAAGGALISDYAVLWGGPLMGKVYGGDEARQMPVTKTTSGIVVLPPDIPLVTDKQIPLRTVLRQAKTACIQCSACTDMCPRYLSGHPLKPHKIMRSLAYSENLEQILELPDVRQAAICSECGICETFACPMGLKPRMVNSWVKGQLAEANIRYSRQGECWQEREERQLRRVPSRRIAARLGVEPYYDYRIDDLEEPEVCKVDIPLKQHIGAPAVPVVSVGDRVEAGQLIARCPEGALGAHVHTGIAGTVTAADGMITIERRP